MMLMWSESALGRSDRTMVKIHRFIHQVGNDVLPVWSKYCVYECFCRAGKTLL